MPFAKTVIEQQGSETWVRDVDGHITASTLRFDRKTGQVIERFGRIACALQPYLRDAGLDVEVRRLWILGCPGPCAAVMRSASCESQDASGAFRFDIAGEIPRGVPLIRYWGYLLTQL